MPVQIISRPLQASVQKGAAIEDIRLFKKYIGENVKIKAAGGIRTREDLEAFLSEGCSRIGTSSAVKLLTEPTD